MSERSSKYVLYDRIFPSRKSATVTPASWTCSPGCLQRRVLTEDERAGVVRFDNPFCERLVADFVEPSEH